MVLELFFLGLLPLISTFSWFYWTEKVMVLEVEELNSNS